jgi:hypothetical protein
MSKVPVHKVFKVLLGSSILFLSSCFSYHSHLDKSTKAGFEKLAKPAAFLQNRTAFPKAYEVIRRSGLYALTQDTAAPVQIRLLGFYKPSPFRCMTGPATVMLFSLGQLPVRIPEEYRLEFEEIRTDTTRCVAYQLQVYQRLWFWDLLSLRKSLPAALASEIKYQKMNGKHDEKE